VNKLTERERILILNSVHERGMRLLDMSTRMSQKSYRTYGGGKPTKKRIDEIYAGHEEHLKLVDKMREMKNELPGDYF